MTENDACLAFSLCNGIGPKTFQRLLGKFGSAENSWEELDSQNAKEVGISENLYKKFDVFRKTFELSNYLEKLKKAKVSVVGFTSQKYPSLLKNLPDPPISLFCKGNLELLDQVNTIGIVGARKITSYGKNVTEKLTRELTDYGFTIVSGLAMGVDTGAHKSAIENRGSTIAVLGCGVDCCTPQENQSLYESILDKNGLIISEYALGTPPSRGSFPARNRIIAGLSLGVLITEAAEDSGSLITAQEAKKIGRPVFAVPGDIQSQMSRGAIKLLKEGAVLVISGKDISDTLHISVSNMKVIGNIQSLKLTTQEKKIIDKLQKEALTIDMLSKMTQIAMVKLMVLVSSLEMRGILENRNGEISMKS